MESTLKLVKSVFGTNPLENLTFTTFHNGLGPDRICRPTDLALQGPDT